MRNLANPSNYGVTAWIGARRAQASHFQEKLIRRPKTAMGRKTPMHPQPVEPSRSRRACRSRQILELDGGFVASDLKGYAQPGIPRFSLYPRLPAPCKAGVLNGTKVRLFYLICATHMGYYAYGMCIGK